MYRNKKDVDKYVESLTAKLSSKELNSRAYSVARLYYDVNDYTNCRKYVEQYLSHKDNNAAAHKLLGQALQKLGHHEKALEQFKMSLDIDPTQTSLILDICELLANDEVSIELGRAKYWCEKAEATFPRHPVTFRLRERIIANADPDPNALIKLLKSELEIRPKDATLHVRLLKHYLLQNKYSEAIEHSYNIEFDASNFQSNYSWYDTLSEILNHNSHDGKSWLYQLLLLTVKERLCLLTLTETPNSTTKSIVECNVLLHAYDQALNAVASAGAPPGCSDFHAALLQHHYGQFALHAATFLLKKAKKDQISWKEAVKLAAPLMLIAWHVVPLDTNVTWLKNAPNKQEAAVKRWFYEGSYRCSQSGHYLVSSALDKNQILLDQISQVCSGAHWKDKLYEKLFTNRDSLSKIKTSYFICNNSVKLTLRLPRRTEVEAYDSDAQRLYPNSLHYFVWMLVNYKNLAEFKCDLFNMLTIKSHKYVNCGPETLDKFDVLAYLYCATLSCKQKKLQQKFFSNHDKPHILPAIITDLLCSLPQMKWWDCAYKFSRNELGNDFTDIRVTLTHGIEVVHCIDSHGLDPELLCTLGRIFKDQAKSCTNVNEKNNYEQRAALYYNSAIPLLEKIKCNLAIKVPEKRMFDYTNELQNKELNLLLEESKIFVAVKYMCDSEYEKAIETLGNLKSPPALFHFSQIYKNMAVEEYSIYKDSNPDSKTSYAVLLSKAKTFAYKSLDKLKEIQEDRKSHLYCDTQDLIEEIENLLSKGDLDLSSNNINDDGKYSSDETISTIANTDHGASSAYHNISSTPKSFASSHRATLSNINASNSNNVHADVKALERIETEIKSLQKRESVICDFMEKTKNWFEDNRNLIISTINSNITDQFKSLKLSVDEVKVQIDECKNECKDVSELKKQVEELKKEVSSLKKGSSTHNMTENDVYNTEDYGNSDNSNFGHHLSYNPSQMLSPFEQRLIPPFPVPTNPYQQLYAQNWGNMYNQFAQPPTVPGASPIFDPSRAPINYPGIFLTPDQLYAAERSQLLPPVPPVSLPSVVPPVTLPAVAPLPVLLPQPVVASTPKSIAKTTASAVSKDTLRTLPVNVVITSSDPLPSMTMATTTPILSVTIPPKHIKGSPHNYQITMPQTSNNAPNLFNMGMSQKSTTAEKPFDTQHYLQNFNTSSQSLNSSQENNSMNANNLSIFCNPVTDFAAGSINTSLNKSRTLSEKSNTSIEHYDPCPDFKPIVPLPAEVKVTTGEEDESVIFSARAKLFRFADKQWKERGLGEMKLLKHKITGKVRVLMRREQVHKICANHIITSEMVIKPWQNEAKAYYWVANDFAEENVVLEQFCIRFKTPEIAKNFYDVFDKSRLEANAIKSFDTLVSNAPKESPQVSTLTTKENTADNVKSTNNTVNIGGFTFSGTPSFKTVKDETPTKVKETTTTKTNIFANLTLKTTTTSSPLSNLITTTLADTTKKNTNQTQSVESPGNLNTSDIVEEFEPNIDFTPVVPLPALIEHKTGEENEMIMFEHRAKLLRFESNTKEWKERGLGNIKLLMHKDNNQKIRLLMRREQVMKVCCNHAITKDMKFEKMPNMDKAVTWCAQDFSEGELKPETFCLRFKTVQICDKFLNSIKSAQSKLDDEVKANTEPKAISKDSGWGDKFKPKSGSWECKVCFIRNEAYVETCVACNSPKDPNVPKKETEPTSAEAPKFSFGIPGQTQAKIDSNKKELGFVKISNECIKIPDTNPPAIDSSWGDKFKPKSGTWECKECYIRNEGNVDTCGACDSPKDPNAPKKESNSIFEGVPKFQFGIPGQTQADVDASKNNTGLTTTKISSNNAFAFGISQNSPMNNTASIFDGTGNHKFSFGSPATSDTLAGTKYTGVIFATPPKVDTQKNSPVNISTLANNDDTTVKVGLLPTPKVSENSLGGQESKSFEFIYKPKTPLTKGKSPLKSPKSNKGEESDDNEYASEDEGHHIHFNPVIPMPDKVDVVTGEENEDELYGHRAKLYRFTQGEWKERGIGVVKILKHKQTGKLRVVMRREQVLKICLNHALTNDIIYTAKDPKSWLFAVNDFSEGQIELERFCLRFKTSEIANDFKEAIDKARTGQIVDKTVKKQDSEEVVFIKEIQATPEEKELAKKLMLPENFFTYNQKSPCQGCRGCDSDKDKYESCNTSLADANQSKINVFNTSSDTLYGTPFNLNKSTDNSIFSTPLESFGLNTTKTPFEFNKTNRNEKDSVFSLNSNLFGTPTSSKPQALIDSQKSVSMKGSLLSAPKLTSLLTNSNDNSEVQSIFGTTQTKPSFNFGDSEKQSIFGNGITESKPGSTSNLFGNTSTLANKSIFSKGNTEDKNEMKSVFGSNIEQKSDGIFSSTAQGSFFGPASINQKSQSADLFAAAASSIFGPKPADTTTNNTQTVFGNMSKDVNNTTSTDENITVKKDPEPDTPFKIDNSLSFAALSSKPDAFTTQKNNNFTWEGAGQQLFGGALKKDGDTEKSHNESTEQGDGDATEEYDPHYEPIVPLPDKIVVTTGEEDEEKLFCERCKLYRFDEKTKEWKERGVGDLKILYHSERKTYRLLLRREQVHKVVLNMLILMDMELLPMNKSEKAFTWAARNYAENPEGEQEMLAVRFKTAQLANTFKDQVVGCTRKLQAQAAEAIREGSEVKTAQPDITPLRLPKNVNESTRVDMSVPTVVKLNSPQIKPDSASPFAIASSTVAQFGTSTVPSSTFQLPTFNTVDQPKQEFHKDEHDEEHDEQDDDEYDYGDHDGDYEEENISYFECEAEVLVQQGEETNRCPEGYVQVLYDHEIYSPKVLISSVDSGEILADLPVHTDTEFQVSSNSCTWSGVDYTSFSPIPKTVTVNFTDPDTAVQFYESCETSKAYCYTSEEPES